MLFTQQRRSDINRLMRRPTTLIVAIITFLEGVVSLAGTPCSVTTETCHRIVPGVVPPEDFVINMTDPVDPATVDASDLTVNGIPADSVVLSNANTTMTFHFHIPPVQPGVNTMHIPAGAFSCSIGGTPEFTCTFTYQPFTPTPTPRPSPTPRLTPSPRFRPTPPPRP